MTTTTNSRSATARTNSVAPELPEELVVVLKRMRLPYLRSIAPEVLATARAQRWDPAEVLRVLLEEEIRGRDEATRRMRRKAAGLPAGKTFSSWRETDSPLDCEDAPQVPSRTPSRRPGPLPLSGAGHWSWRRRPAAGRRRPRWVASGTAGPPSGSWTRRACGGSRHGPRCRGGSARSRRCAGHG